MAESKIRVDLFNPGQVFACLGFMELADVLLGDAEAGFDWKNDAPQTFFHLSAIGKDAPVKVVLRFLKDATLKPLSPKGIYGPWPSAAAESKIFPSPCSELLKSDKKGYAAQNLPFFLRNENNEFFISNWLEGDGRHALKLFAGPQVAVQLMKSALNGDKKSEVQGVSQICPPDDDPFQTTIMGGRFGYDSRGAWDAIGIGSSLDKQNAVLHVSPVVESLSVIGLEFSRPEFLSAHEIRYAAWHVQLPASLARVAFTQPGKFLSRSSCRYFHSKLGNDEQYKKCFPAQEE